eukprot:12151843-Alexandrium_andersonii.AAC.1
MPVSSLTFATYSSGEFEMEDNCATPLEGGMGEADSDGPGGSASVDGSQDPLSAEEGRAIQAA